MNIDVLTIEIGSTITKVNGFITQSGRKPQHVGQGIGLTTVDNDVAIGVDEATKSLATKLGSSSISYGDVIANSSAAGGLRMVATGLTWDMTARAAKEAALGAGAVLYYLTAGNLSKTDLRKITEAKPNIILFAGGVDYGEQSLVLENAKLLAELNLDIPLIFAGNKVLEDEIRTIFSPTDYLLEIVPNVYPSIDEFNIEPTRHSIQKLFSKHIIHAKGMDKIRDRVKKDIIPTPYAVLKITEALYDILGDICVIDVGGATTDVHSVTEGASHYRKILLSPEPKAKRTVEGDLGVYINAENVKKFIGEDSKLIDLQALKPLPGLKEEVYLSLALTEIAVKTAIERHAGIKIELFTPEGKKQYIKGKDLTDIKYLIGTGGALTRLKDAKNILEAIRIKQIQKKLLPLEKAEVLLDTNYVFSSCGCMVDYYRDAAISIALESLKITGLK